MKKSNLKNSNLIFCELINTKYITNTNLIINTNL
ncbi:hypothetical protein HPA93_00540 [Streptococcus suis]|nr:hypothetical protein [Streptococcus suis]HEM5157617.1 hypothetical protein [Streptococcus suis]